MTDRKFNFNPGPSTLPLNVLKELQNNIVEWNQTGMSIIEVSHRSKDYMAMQEETKKLIQDLYAVPDSYDILFLQGGASLQFAMLPMNFMQGGIADYINTGAWAKKAIKEAKLYGQVNIAATTEKDNFSRLPAADNIKLSDNPKYVHLTTNNTIYGTQWHTLPDTGARKLTADMSSDIMSRPMDVSQFDLIYAGAQKNLGPSGVTVVIIRKAWMEQARQDIPAIMQYKTHSDGQSLYNTPPTFQVFALNLVLKEYQKMGGLKKIEAQNKGKADLLYQAIDKQADFYKGTVTHKPDRSWMNATFRLPSEELEAAFIKQAAAQGLHGLKGHRSLGGIRVSMYNAMPVQGIEKLTQFMSSFCEKSKNSVSA